MRELAASLAAMWLIANACGGKAIVDGPPGSGGAGGSKAVSSSSAITTSPMTTTGPGCSEVPSCKRCKTCVTASCGLPPSAASVACRCNNAPGASSFDLYNAFYSCICGKTGDGGSCGARCRRTCTGAGTDQPDCTTCLSSAIVGFGSCNSSYKACSADG